MLFRSANYRTYRFGILPDFLSPLGILEQIGTKYQRMLKLRTKGKVLVCLNFARNHFRRPRINRTFSRCVLLLSQNKYSCETIRMKTIGPLHDPVTWYGIYYAGMQITQWDFQNKGKSGWTGKSFFVLKVTLRYLRPSIIYSVPCDRIVQRAKRK